MKDLSQSSDGNLLSSSNSFYNPSTSSSLSSSTASLTPEEIRTLSQDPDKWDEFNLPPGFASAPPKPNPTSKSQTPEEYKRFMQAKYKYEEWQNNLIRHKLKVKEEIKQIKLRKGL